MNASTEWALVKLGEEASVVEVQDPTTSTAWDVAFFATSVMLNGGDAGLGGLQGHCVCQNAAAGDAAVMAMTTDGALSDFEAVGADHVPTGEEAWLGNGLDPAIEGRVTLEFAVQPGAGAAFGPTEQLTVELDDGVTAAVDLQSGAVTGSGWHVALEGWHIRVNGGVTGAWKNTAATVAMRFFCRFCPLRSRTVF